MLFNRLLLYFLGQCFRRKITTVTVGSFLFISSMRSVHFLWIILNASKASNMKYKTFPNQKSPLFYLFRHYETSPFFGFVRLFFKKFLMSSKGLPSNWLENKKEINQPRALYSLILGTNIFPSTLAYEGIVTASSDKLL